MDKDHPVDMLMLHPDGKTEVPVAAELVAGCKARGFQPIKTIAELEAETAKASKGKPGKAEA